MADWKIFNILLILSFKTVISLNTNLKSNACNEMCQCDEYKNYIRVSCQKQYINTAENLEAPKGVEILDLSRNRLSSLGNLAFVEYPSIINLTLSHNIITTLYLDTFSTLKNLVIINLSNNLLEEFDNKIFEENVKLVSVDLSSNKFMLLQEDRPFLISESIENLSLKNSQFNHIYPSFFKNLPNLRKLDLSKNMLITLFSKPFSYSSKFEFLDLEGNPWQCDRDLEKTVGYLKAKKVTVLNDQCQQEERQEEIIKPVKFERMQMGPPSSDVKSERMQMGPDNYVIKIRKEPTFTNIRPDIRPFFNDVIPFKPRTSAVKMLYSYEEEYEKCLKRVEKLQDQANELEMSMLSSNDVYFIFFIGVAMGVIGIMVAITCCICLHKMCTKSVRRRRATADHTQTNFEQQFMSGVLERPRNRRRRQQYERINQIPNSTARPLVFGNATPATNGSFVATSVEDNPQNVVIAVRPETPPPSYCDIIAKK